VTTTLFIIATLGSIGLPGLNGFIGEFLILGGVFKVNVVWCAIAATGVIFSAIYMLTLVQKVFWGPVTHPVNKGLTDINIWEFLGAMPLIAGIVILGVYPAPLLYLVKPSIEFVLEAARLHP
jgi:NADH-quinone oxidoreductase subunit M